MEAQDLVLGPDGGRGPEQDLVLGPDGSEDQSRTWFWVLMEAQDLVLGPDGGPGPEQDPSQNLSSG